MNKSYTYSFIIPHHNNPKLLYRCLNSIPMRDDIQIIVVDDNSDVALMPRINNEFVEIVYVDAKQTKGAGRARNIGMERASGKWVLFADADDYYNNNFLDVLDQYSDSENDVIYFSASSVISDSHEVLHRTDILNQSIINYIQGKGCLEEVKYKTHTPWNKMIKRDYLEQNHIRFEEVISGNDAMFSFHIGYFTNNIVALPNKLYNYTLTANSITTKKRSYKMLLCGIKNYYKQKYFLDYLHLESWSPNVLQYLGRVLRNRGIIEMIRLLMVLIINYKVIYSERTLYVDFITKGINNES